VAFKGIQLNISFCFLTQNSKGFNQVGLENFKKKRAEKRWKNKQRLIQQVPNGTASSSNVDLRNHIDQKRRESSPKPNLEERLDEYFGSSPSRGRPTERQQRPPASQERPRRSRDQPPRGNLQSLAHWVPTEQPSSSSSTQPVKKFYNYEHFRLDRRQNLLRLEAEEQETIRAQKEEDDNRKAASAAADCRRAYDEAIKKAQDCKRFLDRENAKKEQRKEKLSSELDQQKDYDRQELNRTEREEVQRQKLERTQQKLEATRKLLEKAQQKNSHHPKQNFKRPRLSGGEQSPKRRKEEPKKSTVNHKAPIPLIDLDKVEVAVRPPKKGHSKHLPKEKKIPKEVTKAVPKRTPFKIKRSWQNEHRPAFKLPTVAQEAEKKRRRSQPIAALPAATEKKATEPSTSSAVIQSTTPPEGSETSNSPAVIQSTTPLEESETSIPPAAATRELTPEEESVLIQEDTDVLNVLA